MKGFTGKHKIIFRLTGKSQNILYLEFGRSSVDEPKEKYALNGLKMNGQNELQYSVNVTKFARDKGDASMVTMAVGLYSADGLLEKVQLKPVFDSDIVLTGEKSYATKEEVLTIDVTGMDAKTTVKAFLWDNLLSQKLLMPATVGKLSELTQL